MQDPSVWDNSMIRRIRWPLLGFPPWQFTFVPSNLVVSLDLDKILDEQVSIISERYPNITTLFCRSATSHDTLAGLCRAVPRIETMHLTLRADRYDDWQTFSLPFLRTLSLSWDWVSLSTAPNSRSDASAQFACHFISHSPHLETITLAGCVTSGMLQTLLPQSLHSVSIRNIVLSLGYVRIDVKLRNAEESEISPIPVDSTFPAAVTFALQLASISRRIERVGIDLGRIALGEPDDKTWWTTLRELPVKSLAIEGAREVFWSNVCRQLPSLERLAARNSSVITGLFAGLSWLQCTSRSLPLTYLSLEISPYFVDNTALVHRNLFPTLVATCPRLKRLLLRNFRFVERDIHTVLTGLTDLVQLSLRTISTQLRGEEKALDMAVSDAEWQLLSKCNCRRVSFESTGALTWSSLQHMIGLMTKASWIVHLVSVCYDELRYPDRDTVLQWLQKRPSFVSRSFKFEQIALYGAPSVSFTIGHRWAAQFGD